MLRNNKRNLFLKLHLPDGDHLFIQTRPGRWFEITNCSIFTDGMMPNRDGLIPNAKPLSSETVADLVAKSKPETAKHKPKPKVKRDKLSSTYKYKGRGVNIRQMKKWIENYVMSIPLPTDSHKAKEKEEAVH